MKEQTNEREWFFYSEGGAKGKGEEERRNIIIK